MFVADFTSCRDRRGQIGLREQAETCPQVPRNVQCVMRLRLDTRVALAVVVIHKVAAYGAKETGEVIEAVAVMPADAAVEYSGNALGVLNRGKSIEQVLTLLKDRTGGGENAPVIVGQFRRRLIVLR